MFLQSLQRQRRTAQSGELQPVPAAPLPDSGVLDIPPSTPVVSWPAAFLASVVVVASFSYHYMLITHGVDPMRAVQYLMAIVIPVTAIVLPSSAVGAATRAVFRFLSAGFGNLGGGAR